jgi:hypothetical protein
VPRKEFLTLPLAVPPDTPMRKGVLPSTPLILPLKPKDIFRIVPIFTVTSAIASGRNARPSRPRKSTATRNSLEVRTPAPCSILAPIEPRRNCSYLMRGTSSGRPLWPGRWLRTSVIHRQVSPCHVGQSSSCITIVSCQNPVGIRRHRSSNYDAALVVRLRPYPLRFFLRHVRIQARGLEQYESRLTAARRELCAYATLGHLIV